MDEEALVSCNPTGRCPPPIECGDIGTGEGELTLETMPEALTILKACVHAPEGKAGDQRVCFTQPAICIEMNLRQGHGRPDHSCGRASGTW